MNKQRILNQTTRLAVCLSLLLGVAACDEKETPDQMANNFSATYWAENEVCYDGVVYINRFRHFGVKVMPNGMPATETKLGIKC